MRRPACYAAIPGVKNEENRLPIKPTEKLATAENIKKRKNDQEVSNDLKSGCELLVADYTCLRA